MRILPSTPFGTLAEYEAAGGGRGIEAARKADAGATIDAVAASGLRGRGGGGFPTGRKWKSLRAMTGDRRFVVVNGAEGEPGTFKDRALIRANPYALVEGLAIAAGAIGAGEAFIGLKAQFETEIARVTEALAAAAGAGWLDDVEVSIVAGPDDYLYGEETALLEVIEGNDPLPRILPPYQHGLFGAANPTLVNNVETLMHVPAIVADGGDAFRAVGTPKSPGTTVYTVCGDVAREGVWELPLGTRLRVLVEAHAGGMRDGRVVKMICSGVANPVLGGDALDTPADYEALGAAGGGLGSAGFVVYDDTVCAVAVARVFSQFLSTASCGQCPPCKIGSGVITDELGALQEDGDPEHLPKIQRALLTVADGNRCYLAVEEQQMVSSILRRFPEDFVAHEEGRCPLRHDIVLPKITDLVGNRFVYAPA